MAPQKFKDGRRYLEIKMNKHYKAMKRFYEEIRRARTANKQITASRFGQVVRRLSKTSCHCLVKSIIYQKDLNTTAVNYGRTHEATAIAMYEEQEKVNVEQCGIFVDMLHPYLGASPDGIVGDNILVEVKCLNSVQDQPLLKAAMRKKMCVEVVDNQPRLRYR